MARMCMLSLRDDHDAGGQWAVHPALGESAEYMTRLERVQCARRRIQQNGHGSAPCLDKFPSGVSMEVQPLQICFRKFCAL